MGKSIGTARIGTKICRRCGKIKPRSEFSSNGNGTKKWSPYCKACKVDYNLAQRRSKHADTDNYMHRWQDRIDCVHYNATDKQDRSWRDGCLYEAAKENRPSVCLRVCGRYEPQPLEMTGHLTSSMGLCLEDPCAGHDNIAVLSEQASKPGIRAESSR